MIRFHRFLIGTAILFCASFAFWSLITYGSSRKPVLLVLFVSFLLASIGLGYYLANLKRFLHR